MAASGLSLQRSDQVSSETSSKPRSWTIAEIKPRPGNGRLLDSQRSGLRSLAERVARQQSWTIAQPPWPPPSMAHELRGPPARRLFVPSFNATKLRIRRRLGGVPRRLSTARSFRRAHYRARARRIAGGCRAKRRQFLAKHGQARKTPCGSRICVAGFTAAFFIEGVARRAGIVEARHRSGKAVTRQSTQGITHGPRHCHRGR